MKNALAIFAFIFAFVLFRYMGIVGLIFLATYFMGDKFSKWYIKKHKELGSLAGWVAWSNILTWLLPPLAMLTVVATFNFSTVSNKEDQKGFKILAFIGLLLAIINAIWGILQRLNGV